MANNNKGTMVLDKDTDLKFPHVLIIDASAGTGKTHTLAQRYVQYILSKKIPYNDLSNILAVTFTNNAAREMKQRILEWLKKLALDIECEEKSQTQRLINLRLEEITRYATEAVDNIIEHWSDFHVQTIDSFMNRILRASAHELGMPFEVEVTESYETLVDASLALVLEMIGDKIPRSEVDQFLRLLNQESDSFVWNPMRRINKKFIGFLKEEGKVLEKIIFEDNQKLITEKLNRIHEIYKKVVDSGYEEDIKKPIKDALHNKNIKDLIKKFTPDYLWFKEDSLTDEAIKACADLLKVIEELTVLYSNFKYYHYGFFYEHFKAILNTEKRKNEIIHFDDINKKLAEYLKKDIIPEIYYRLGDTLYHFLLDEFQDTDRVQWENMRPLLEEAFSKGGSFFAVGDMKQAIYMFRKADYRIMRRIVNDIKLRNKYGKSSLPLSVIDNALVIPLEENFRSGSAILDYVDNIFKKRLKEIQNAIVLKEDRTGLTEYVQKTKKKEKGYVRTILIEEGKNNPEKNMLYEILDDVTKRYRARDITILARKNEYIETVVEWLTEKNIPIASFSSLNIKKRKIIMEITSLLQFLDSPIDNLSFANFITGDIFIKAAKSKGKEISPDEIFNFIFEAPKRKTVLENLYIYFRRDLKFSEFWLLFFEDLFNKVGYLPLYELVCQVFRTFNIVNNFKDEAGFLVRFLEAISSIEARGMNSIKDFIEIVSEEREESILNVMLPDYIDAVKVMTFHKAKGLGFPVVINMIYDGRGKDDYVYFEKNGENIKIYYILDDFIDKSSILKRIHSEKELDEKIQTLNLLYVANTRAKNELYNIVIKKEPRYHDPCIDLFEAFEIGEKKLAIKEKVIQPKSTEIFVPLKIEAQFAEKAEKEWSIVRLLETKKGEFFHEVLARIDYISDNLDKEIDEIIKRISVKVKEKYNIEEVKKSILEFINLEKIKKWFEIKPGRQIQQEIEYTSEDGVLYRLDRVIIDPDAITVIDFKTGEKELGPYRSQLKDYMKILSALDPEKKVKGYLAFVEAKKIIEIK